MAVESLVPTSISAEHANDTTYNLHVRQPGIEVVRGVYPIALTRLDIITASSHQNDSVETRLDARRRRTANVESSMSPIHVPMTMCVLS